VWRMFPHGGLGRAARRRMNPAASSTKPAEAGFALPAAGFSPPACAEACRTFRHTWRRHDLSVWLCAGYWRKARYQLRGSRGSGRAAVPNELPGITHSVAALAILASAARR
jgi:hypothetical protein